MSNYVYPMLIGFFFSSLFSMEESETSLSIIAGHHVQQRRKRQDRSYQGTIIGKKSRTFHFSGIYDGHGDNEFVVEHLKKNMHKRLEELLCREDTKKIDKKLFEELFHTVEEEMEEFAYGSGSTATICLIDSVKKLLHLAWVGDSRAIVANKEGEIVYATQDHRFTHGGELERIKDHKNKPGTCIRYSRSMPTMITHINSLGMTRSLGDRTSKNINPKIIISKPAYTRFNIEKKDASFIVMASDGLWDYYIFTPEIFIQEVKDRIKEYRKKGSLTFKQVKSIAKSIVESIPQCDSKGRLNDDISVQVIVIDPNSESDDKSCIEE